jgi:preprotein translocase subunit SecF
MRRFIVSSNVCFLVESLLEFVFAMLIGIVVGTYSSLFIANTSISRYNFKRR